MRLDENRISIERKFMCDLVECRYCKYKCKSNITDSEIEKLWKEFEDVLLAEDEESDDSCNLVLASDWEGCNKGTIRDTIWHWFDTHYSKGISFLLYKREV